MGIRLFAIWSLFPQPFEAENLRAAIALAFSGTLADPFATPTGPTAHVAPLYPALIALGIGLSGDVAGGQLFARSAIAILFAAFVALLPKAAESIGLSWRTGVAAAVVFVPFGAPIFLSIEVTGQSETPLAMIALMALVCWSIWALARKELDLRTGALLGLCWGIGAHVSPVLLPPMLAILLSVAISRRHPPISLARFSLVMLSACTLALAPWTVRNYRALGHFVLVRDNFGLELSVSNGEGASADMRDNMRTTMLRHPFLSFTESRRVAAEGEVSYNARRGEEAIQWLSERPSRFFSLTMSRIALFLYPAPAREHHAVFYLSTLVLALVGFVRLAFRDRWLALTLSAVFVSFAAPYALVQSTPRYSYPVLWLLVLLAAWVVFEAIDWLRGRSYAR